jgi:hypothetical protein
MLEDGSIEWNDSCVDFQLGAAMINTVEDSEGVLGISYCASKSL